MLDQYKRILVAVDGSKEAERAFFKAVNVAKRNEATLIITHILDIGAYTTFEGFDKSLTDRVYNYAEELLNDYAEKAKEAGLEKVEKVLEYGSPKVKIAKEIADKGRISINGKVAKSSTDVKIGDELTLLFGNKTLVVKVTDIRETTKKDEAENMYEILDVSYAENFDDQI